jgi:DNA-binding transcriptional regulator YdaS (Cro superfamily)
MRKTKQQRLVIEAIKKAAAKVGGQGMLAVKLRLKSQGAISYWISVGEVPPRFVLRVEKLSGVSRHDINPEMYPRDGGYDSP